MLKYDIIGKALIIAKEEPMLLKFRVLVLLLGWLVLPALPQQLTWKSLPETNLRQGFTPESIVGSANGTLYYNAEGRGPRGEVVSDLLRLNGQSWFPMESTPFRLSGEQLLMGTITYGTNIPYGKGLYRSVPLQYSGFFGNRMLTEVQSITETGTATCFDRQQIPVTGKDPVYSIRGIFPGLAGKLYVHGLRVINNTPSTSGLYFLNTTGGACNLQEPALLPESKHILLQVVEMAENRFLAERLDHNTLARDVVLLTLNPSKKEIEVQVLVTTNQNLSVPNPPPYVGYSCCKLTADYEARTAVIDFQEDRLVNERTFLFADQTLINKDGGLNPAGLRRMTNVSEAFYPVKQKIQAVSVRGQEVVFLGAAANSQSTLDTAVVYHAGINSHTRLLLTGSTVGNSVVQPTDVNFRRFTGTNGKTVSLLGTKLYQASITWPPPTATITADPPKVTRGNFTTLNWEVANAWLVTLNGKAVPLKGVQTVVPDTTTEFVIKAVGPDKQVESSVTVTVLEPPPPPPPPAPMPEFDVWIDQPQQAGQPATVNWWVTNATSIIIRSADGNYQALLPAVDGSTQVNLTSSQNITVLVEGKGGSLSREFWITVPEAPKPENPVPTEDKPQSPPTEPQNPPAAPPSEPEEP